MKYFIVLFTLLISGQADALFWCHGFKKYYPWCSSSPLPQKPCDVCRINGPRSELVPDDFHLSLENFQFSYDQETCGNLLFSLSPTDDLQLEFDSFRIQTKKVEERWCTISVEVNLPRGLAIGPAGIAVEGDYLINTGDVSIFAQLGLDGGDYISLVQQYVNPGWAMDTFLLEKSESPKSLGGCGARTRFDIRLKLLADRGEEWSEAVIGLSRANMVLDFSTTNGVSAKACK